MKLRSADDQRRYGSGRRFAVPGRILRRRALVKGTGRTAASAATGGPAPPAATNASDARYARHLCAAPRSDQRPHGPAGTRRAQVGNPRGWLVEPRTCRGEVVCSNSSTRTPRPRHSRAMAAPFDAAANDGEIVAAISAKTLGAKCARVFGPPAECADRAAGSSVLCFPAIHDGATGLMTRLLLSWR